MAILKIWLKGQFLIRYYMINLLIFLKLLNVMGIKEILLQWFTHFSINCLLLAKEHMQNFKKNWLVAWKMTQRIWLIFMRVVTSLAICNLMGSICPKHEKVQKNYASWEWRVMQSLKKNWLLDPKMTTGIWWILMRPVASLKFKWQQWDLNPQPLSS